MGYIGIQHLNVNVVKSLAFSVYLPAYRCNKEQANNNAANLYCRIVDLLIDMK